MGKRYVPRTYKNRRALRIFLWSVLTIAVAAVILFLILFFFLENYWVDEQWALPWLMDDAAVG